MRNLLLVGLIAGFFFWLTNISSWADKIPNWVQWATWGVLIISGSLSDDVAKDKLKEKWKSTLAWLSDSLFSYDLLVRFSVPYEEPYASIFRKVEDSLSKRGYNWSIAIMTKNVRQYKIAQPPITISIRATPDVDIDSDWEVNAQNRIEISGVEPQIVSYRSRRGAQVTSVIALMHDLAIDIHNAFPGDTEPQILMTINRLKGRYSPRRPKPPIAMVAKEVGSGVRVVKDDTAIQIFSPNMAGILRELQADIGQLEPIT